MSTLQQVRDKLVSKKALIDSKCAENKLVKEELESYISEINEHKGDYLFVLDDEFEDLLSVDLDKLITDKEYYLSIKLKSKNLIDDFIKKTENIIDDIRI